MKLIYLPSILFWLCEIHHTVYSATCTYSCQEAYNVQERYTKKCGKFHWRRCTRYRQVTKYRTKVCYTCCSGWGGNGCNTPLCPSGCQGRGSCSQPNVCSCHVGYSPPRCDDINECASNNGGCEHTCANTVGSFNCNCNGGFQLKSDRRTCAPLCFGSTSCPNGGKCERPDFCSCPNGFSSPNCNDVNECATSNGGCDQICTNTLGSFTCGCNNGFVLDSNGKTCEDIDECSTDNGGCGQNCNNTIGSFHCSCEAGFSLDIDDKSCVDIDECLENNGDCQHICNNTVGSYNCECRPGFDLNTDGKGCTDIDECQKLNGGCSDKCVNTEGSYHCSCPNGFKLDETKLQCEDINECESGNGGCEHGCNNTIGSYHCTCKQGFKLMSDNRSCEDVDECLDNNGGCTQICVNTKGSYECDCGNGYQKEIVDTVVTCEDINECKVFNGGCEHTCVNAPGSFSCACKDGFDLNFDNMTCSGKDQCLENNGGCGQICIRQNEGRRCACGAGYMLHDDGITCEDRDECLIKNGGCSHTCINTIGSFFCQCPNGFEMSIDNSTCRDINECKTNNGGCDQICVNQPGTFHCLCQAGFEMKSSSCLDINECDTNNPCEELCSNTVGSFVCSCGGNRTLDSNRLTCSDNDICKDITNCEYKCVSYQNKGKCDCPAGYELASDEKSCQDIDECKIGSSGCEDVCLNTEGSYLCYCNTTGYILNSDNHTCSDICKPNPCKHDGICQYSDGNGFNCNCSNGGFSGATCERGRIHVEIPKVIGINTPTSFVVNAKPDYLLTIRPQGKNLKFSPEEVTIVHPDTSAEFDILSNIEGQHPFDLKLSGADSSMFGDTIKLGLLVGNVFTRLRLPKKNLPRGCFVFNIAKCPEGTEKLSFSLSSTSPWYVLNTNKNVKFTFGVVFVESGKLSIPVSMIGIKVEDRDGKYEISYVSSQIKPSDGEKLENQGPDDCLDIPLSSNDIRDLMYNNAFARQYLLSLYEHLPSWIRLSENEIPILSISDVKADLMLGEETQQIISCKGAPVHASRYYSVFQFESGASMSILNKTVPLKSLTKGRRFCLIVDICKAKATTIILMFPPGSRDILKDLEIVEGLDVGVKGIGLSLTRDLSVDVPSKSLQVWTGDEIIPYQIDRSASLWLSGEFTYKSDKKAFKVELSGDSTVYAVIPHPKTLLTHVFLEEWHAYLKLNAAMDLTLKYKLFGKDRTLYLPRLGVLDSTMYVSIGGTQDRRMCAPKANPSGIFFGMDLVINPFGGIPIIGEYINFNPHKAYAFLTYDPKNDIANSKPINLAHDVFKLKERANRIGQSIKAYAKELLSHVTELGKQFCNTLTLKVDILVEKITSLADGFNLQNLPKLSDLLAVLRDFIKEVKTPFMELIDQLRMPVNKATNVIVASITSEIDDIRDRIELLQRRIMDQVTAVMTKKSGWGLKYRSTISIFFIEFTGLDVEFVYSADYLGQCSRYADAYKLLKGQPAVRALGRFSITLRLYWWLSANFGGGLELAMAEETDDFVLRFTGRIEIFSVISVASDVFISKQGLTTGTELKVWNLFRARVIISSTVNVPWKKMNIKAEVMLLAGGDNSFEGSLHDALIKLANEIGDMANKRLTEAQEAFDHVVQKLNEGQDWLDKKKKEFEKAKKVFDSAVKELKRLEGKVKDLEKPFNKAISKLSHAQDKVNRLCKTRHCKDICIPGTRCSKRCKRKWKIRICYPRCSKTRCMVKLPNLPCQTANELCRAVRKTAYHTLGLAKLTVKTVIVGMDVARAAVRATGFVVDKSKIAVDAALLPFDLAKVGLEALKVSFKAGKIALEGVKLAVKGAIAVFNFVIKSLPIDIKQCGFSAQLSIMDEYIFEVSCEINLFRTGWHNIKARINFKSPIATIWEAARKIIKSFVNVLGIRKKRDVEFAAAARLNRLRREIGEINEEEILSNTTINFDDKILDSSSNESSAKYLDDANMRIDYFKKKCNKNIEVTSYLTDAVSILHDIVTDMVSDEEDDSDLAVNNVRENEVSDYSLDSMGINITEAFDQYNLTREDLEATLAETLESDSHQALVNVSQSLQEFDVPRNNEEIDVLTVIDIWKSEMENYTNERYPLSRCNSFLDCIVVSFGDMYSMYEGLDVNIEDLGTVKSNIMKLEENIMQLVSGSKKQSISQIINQTTLILDLLSALRKKDVFCMQPPIIEKAPSSQTILEGKRLELQCSVTNSTNFQIWWFKDGKSIHEALGVDKFTVISVKDEDAGTYNCVVGNVLFNSTSEKAKITIAKPPIIIKGPDKSITTVEGQNVELMCESIGYPKPLVYWCRSDFESEDSECQLHNDSSTLILNEPTYDQSGVYWCRVENKYKSINSTRTEVFIQKAILASPVTHITIGYLEFDDVSGGSNPVGSLESALLAFGNVPGLSIKSLKNVGNLVKFEASVKTPGISSNIDLIRNYSKMYNDAENQLLMAVDNIKTSIQNEDFITVSEKHRNFAADRGQLHISPLLASCPAGSINAKSQGILCNECPKNSFKSEDMTNCEDCPNGTFALNPGSSICLDQICWNKTCLTDATCQKYETDRLGYKCVCDKEKYLGYDLYIGCYGKGFSKIRTENGNANHAPCFFPWIYNGVNRTSCIDEDSRRPWCSSTENYDRDNLWGYCSTNQEVYGGNDQAGASCAFPFIFQGKAYYECLPAKNARTWCGTVKEFDEWLYWGYCK